jgi:hypothetical protein
MIPVSKNHDAGPRPAPVNDMIVGLGYQGSGGPTVNHSVIAGIAGTEFYLGMLGLNPRPTNFTTLNNPQPSFLTRLKNDSSIPSLSYSYTAGAPYRLNKALGSLILGGYDTSRFQDTNSSYAFFSDQSRDLTVGLQSITTNISHSDTSLLPSGVISTFIDSSVAEIYLPLDACQAFEKAFNLTYNSTAGLYLVNDTLHQQLLAANPSVTFTIATAITGGPGFNITYPYASFDLQAQPPLLSSSSRYFPLQRATNNTQYTLGRTFLQEAYLVVDYERNNFSVHPCVWNASATPNVVTIPDLSSTTPTASIVARPGTSNHQLSGGAIAGIVIGAIAGVAAIVGLLLWFFVIAPRRQKNKAVELEAPSEISTSPKTDGDHTNVPEIGGDGAHAQEMEGVGKKLQEIEGSSPAAKVGELETPIDAMYAEMSGDQRLAPELASHEIHEMHAEPEIHEMPGSDVRLQEMPETSK